MPRFCAVACFLWVLVETGFGLHHTQSAKWVPDPAKHNTAGLPFGGSDNDYPLYTRETLPKKPMLLYIHLEKTAGSFIGSLMRSVLGKENHLGYHNAHDGVEYVPDNYFVVSNVRNPCSRAISGWSYCCQKAWIFQTFGHDDSAVFQDAMNRLKAGKCPTFNGTDEKHITVSEYNVPAFYERVIKKGNSFDDILAKEFKNLNGGHKRVNCWIRYEHLEDDSRACLEKYATYSNVTVNWRAFEESWSKANTNPGHHSECKAYYENYPDLVQKMKEVNSITAEEFGYTECCPDAMDATRSTRMATVEANPDVVEEFGDESCCEDPED